jgi:hypothetical protein
MNRRRWCVLAGISVAAILALSWTALAADNWLGTWKLNTAKSKYNPGPAPKSQTVKQEAWEGGVKATTDGVGADGKPTHTEYAAKYDGKDYPWKGNPNADMISMKKIDDNTYEAVWKLNGKVTITAKTVISGDGKTRTNTQTGTDAQGHKVNNVVVYDRQ